jgi:hypothetical protein
VGTKRPQELLVLVGRLRSAALETGLKLLELWIAETPHLLEGVRVKLDQRAETSDLVQREPLGPGTRPRLDPN